MGESLGYSPEVVVSNLPDGGISSFVNLFYIHHSLKICEEKTDSEIAILILYNNKINPNNNKQNI